jgi:5-methylcytosine-specific restriction endonuclease McrA
MANLYDRRWRKRREQQLREHPLCRLCMAILGRATAATVADHITPHRGDPVLFAGPLQSLCKSCHDSWKQSAEAGRSLFKGADRNGMPLDPRHPWNAEADRPAGGS